ncbi:MAG: hypothetical protein MJE77_26495 [Proteobacteria bacterium]|nr:hypothetical protein [Pseudomonadota bacterium]
MIVDAHIHVGTWNHADFLGRRAGLSEGYLMGSDCCLAHPSMYTGAVSAMSLSDAARARILDQHARELFGSPLPR